MGIICHKHEMQQLVLKENIPHPNHNPDEGRRGRISKPWHYMYNKQRTGKIIIRVTIYPNHTNINFYIKFHEQEAHHKVVPATGRCGRSTEI